MSILKMKVYVFTDKLKLKKVLLLTDNPESASHQIFILLQIFWFGQITDRLFLTFSPVMLLKSTEDKKALQIFMETPKLGVEWYTFYG